MIKNNKSHNNILKSLLFGLMITLSSFVQAAGEEYLDYGLHWVNVDNNGNESQEKGVDHDGNIILNNANYYDSSKPTVIYFHGWQSGMAEDGYNVEDFYFDDVDANTAQAWKDQGWNVGIYHWGQFADEDELKDAEAKIWSTEGDQGMRYRLDDGSYSTEQAPNKSLGLLAFEHITTALDDNTSGNIRFVGHSLGNQLAVVVAKKINKAVNYEVISSHLMPGRVDLLDPFWSQGDKSYLSGDWTGERVRNYIENLISEKDIAVTWYKTSAIFDLWIGDQNTDLEKQVALINNRFWYLSAIDIADKHVHARKWYFMSMAYDAPEEVTINWWGRRSKTGYDAASATSSNNHIRTMMNDDEQWDQVEGRYTADPSDDQFEVKDY
jgi:hypothetical protein